MLGVCSNPCTEVRGGSASLARTVDDQACAHDNHGLRGMRVSEPRRGIYIMEEGGGRRRREEEMIAL
ncbi:hypothetical protein FKM82_020931 [Ascaphus truei]